MNMIAGEKSGDADKFTRQDKVFNLLNALNITYEVIRHPAVYTIEDIDALGIDQDGEICKNLFLRDARGGRHFLVVLLKSKKADLKSLQQQLGTTRLGFASEERLRKYLGLSKGEVTPLAVINDREHAVELVFDRELAGRPRLGFHPNDNTATVLMTFESLKSYVAHLGSNVHYVDI